jgi:hypothetical protein
MSSSPLPPSPPAEKATARAKIRPGSPAAAMGPGTAKPLLFQDAKVVSKVVPGAMLSPDQLNVTWLGVKLAAA